MSRREMRIFRRTLWENSEIYRRNRRRQIIETVGEIAAVIGLFGMLWLGLVFAGAM